jgi:hypothetical protein
VNMAGGNRKRAKRRSLVALLSVLLATVMLLSVPASAYAAGWGRLNNINKFWKQIEKQIKKQDVLTFKDIDEAIWALASIAKMKGLGIINGYGDNTFKPNAAVKQAEALTMMVRAFGLEEEAQELQNRWAGLYTKDNDKDSGYFQSQGRYFPYVPSSARWALGYVLIAVDEGWVKFSELYPEQPASRAWISMVMVRALGHEEEAQSKMNKTLPFKDRNSVKSSFVGYIAESVDMGLFEGYDDNTFKPNKAVSRAEMATILERFIDEELPSDTPYLVKGKVLSVGSSSIKVLVGSRTVTYSISKDALVIIDGRSSVLSKVNVGDNVEVLSNGSGVAILIEVKDSIPDTSEITGEIVSKSDSEKLRLQLEDGSYQTVRLDSKCSIKHGSQNLRYLDLQVGDIVRATVRDGVASALTVISRWNEVPNSGTVTGEIQSMTTVSNRPAVVLKTDDGITYTIALRSDCVIRYGATNVNVEDLRRGDEVTVRLENQRATTIQIRQMSGYEKVEGVVVWITSNYVVVRKSDGSQETIALSDGARVLFNGQVLKVEDLRLGDKIEAKMRDKKCYEISISERSRQRDVPNSGELRGTLQSVVLGSKNTSAVLVLKSGDAWYSIPVASDCSVKFGSSSFEVKDLDAGDQVKVTLQRKQAKSVEVLEKEGYSLVEGAIAQVNSDRNGHSLVIRKDDSSRVTVELSDDVRIVFNGKEIDVDDLSRRDVIEARVKGKECDYLTVVERSSSEQEVPNSGTLTGVIESVSDSDSEIVLKVGDVKYTIPLVSGCPIKYGSSVFELKDLKEGDKLTVTLRRSQASAIQVIEKDKYSLVKGNVVEINADGRERTLVLRKENGSRVTIPLTRDVRIVFNNEQLDIDQLVRKDVVELRLYDGRCDYITVLER